MVLSNVETFCNVALGEKVAEDYLLARDVVITISSITDHVRVSPITRETLSLVDDLGIT